MDNNVYTKHVEIDHAFVGLYEEYLSLKNLDEIDEDYLDSLGAKDGMDILAAKGTFEDGKIAELHVVSTGAFHAYLRLFDKDGNGIAGAKIAKDELTDCSVPYCGSIYRLVLDLI